MRSGGPAAAGRYPWRVWNQTSAHTAITPATTATA
jgi:hypothetical protein